MSEELFEFKELVGLSVVRAITNMLEQIHDDFGWDMKQITIGDIEEEIRCAGLKFTKRGEIRLDNSK